VKTYCCVDRKLIPEKRARRGSKFCSNECHGVYRIARRQEKAKKACRLCGRGMPKRKQEEAVRSAHSVAGATA
jgi:hypothetical protein